MSLKQRILLYFYGAPHMLGSLFALIGLRFFFVGLIKSYWYLIVPGLYLAGVLIIPASREHHLKLRRETNIGEIRKALDKLLDSCRNEVARIVYDRVQSIVSSIQ
jgi:hypothetical protein